MKRVLIANRGEIAVRIIRACRERGVETVAVYSDADAHARHVSLADFAVRLGPPPPAESYLSIDALMNAARQTGADALHPGYGFLSEDASLPDACRRQGIAFIGPSPAAMSQLGSKIAARQLALAAGVPVVPGAAPASQSDEAILAAADSLGFPLLLKPSAGGGGIGMRVVRESGALANALAQARREALSAFGDGTLLVERLIERPRHVEFQIVADGHGEVCHLFERECSVQRRHQKVLEESPSPAVTASLRSRMGAAAVALARAAGYQNAGTVEFLVDGRGDAASFYFLEMNTRLQVEHPVTELVTGLDLVHAQLRVAAGMPLGWAQEEVHQRGHAIEARVYAEDPSNADLPQAGILLRYREPIMPGVRVDGGFAEGDTVSVHYDPLLAKVIAWGESREQARVRLTAALREFVILGVRTNITFLLRMLGDPDFVNGSVDTGWLDREGTRLRPPAVPDRDGRATAVAAFLQGPPAAAGTAEDPWSSLRGFRV